MKKILAVVAAIVATFALLFIGVVAPATASGGTTISKYGDTFSYNGDGTWTVTNTDNAAQINNVGNTHPGFLCATNNVGPGVTKCVSGASYTFSGDTSVTGYSCAYLQADGTNSPNNASWDTVPGDSSKNVCVSITTSPDAVAAVKTTAASCSAAETVAEITPPTNASWASIVYSGQGNLTFSAVATASAGHTFTVVADTTVGGVKTHVSSDGTTETFSGTLDVQQTTGCTVTRVCIPDSAVSYNYSHNHFNTGTITVADVANSTGSLCNPFYVTATSWKYTNNASNWPQKVDVVDQLGKISVPGIYTYTALVSCGQGDIYASTDASAPSLNPANYPTDTGYLENPNTPFKEHFLSDMGFTQTQGSGATYYNDANSCFQPASETGFPTPSKATCANPNGNELSLPAVLGGQWTVSNAGYSKTYPINTAEDITTVPNGYAAYTVTLSDGSVSDGYKVDTKTSSWAPNDMSLVDCNTVVTPVKPDVSDVISCIDGSIVIPTTTGVTYYLDGAKVASGSTQQNLTGSHTVTATADDGYEFEAGSYPPVTTSNPTGGWTYNLGSTATCEIVSVLSDCSYNTDTAVSSKDVTLTFDNTGKNSTTTFQVGSGGTIYTVDANSKLSQDVGSVTSSGGTFQVYVNGATTPITVTVTGFDTCIPVVPGDPSVTEQTCDAVTNTGANDGAIGVTLDPRLVYTITGPTGPNSTVRTPITSATTDNLAPGDYVVSVVPVGGYVIAGPTSWPLTLTIHDVACTVAPATELAGCTSDLANPTEIQGKIDITLNSNIVYSITGGAIVGSQVLTAAETAVPDGTYTVSAALTQSASDAGVKLVGDTSWGPYSFAALCLPVLPAFHAFATGVAATCSSTGSTSGFISLQHMPSEIGKVKYSIENLATHKVVDVGHTVTRVNEAPGKYEVTGSPVDPADGISGKSVFDVTVGAALGACGTLAFTGGGFAGYLGVTFAIGMLFLGAAALWMRRRFGSRSAH